MDHILDIENLDDKFISIIKTQEFQKLQSAYNDAKYVLFFGHGGNLGVADHAAIDASRLTDKNVIAPGSGILATSIIGDTNFNDWLKTWVEMRVRGINPKECLVLGMSCSSNGQSSNTIRTALEWASEQGSHRLCSLPQENITLIILSLKLSKTQFIITPQKSYP